MTAEAASSPPVPAPRGRCRCGHPPSDHLVVRAVAGSANFRLVPAGPCRICGEATCRAYTAGASG